MERYLDRIIDDLLRVLQIPSLSNLQVKKRIDKGFSGAEVYLIELLGESVYKGIYFLKIDTEEDEYRKAEKGYKLLNTASIVKAVKIQDFFVMLLEIAGKSSISYTSFYDIEELSIRRKAIQVIIPNILSNSVENDSCIGQEIEAPTVFFTQLSRKLDPESVLAEFVSGAIKNKKSSEVTGFIFDKGYYLPNAYAFAVNSSLWMGKKIKNTSCYIHGDFHGDNVFYSVQEDAYAMIDLALYREDGYLFYDVAYFELSLLLRTSGLIDMMGWIILVKHLAQKQWDDVNCIDKEVFQDIANIEDGWIQEKTNHFYNYKDCLIEARLIARVLAGLNYAGKKKVDKEIRKKAFLYACACLECLLEIKEITGWKEGLVNWREIAQDYMEDEIENFCAETDNFDDTQRYVLILGDTYNYSEEVLRALTRIHWCGIITFQRTETIEQHLKRINILNAITVENNFDLITRENLWCLYADGVDYNPESLKDTYPKWRNRYGKFLDEFARKLDEVIAPDELQFIIDRNSFTEAYCQNLNRLYESLDLIENTCVNIAILDNKGKYDTIDEENYERISFNHYKTSIESIAEFCLRYLRNISEEGITLPSITGIRKPVPEQDYKFLKNYVFLLHNRVIEYEGNVSEEEKRSFYYGKDILWQAINEKLYVERDEYQIFDKKILQEIEKKSQFALRVVHSPGAGASVLFRVLAWNFRNNYPVVTVDSINKNIIECVQRLYSLSGKHVLVFLDGEFSENDMTQLIARAHYNGLKVGFIFPGRSYDKSKKDLSALSLDNALNFCSEYEKQMKELKQYTSEELLTRSCNMKKLATDRSLITYRLPFFFGINAFEDDYESISDYLKGIMDHIEKDTCIRQVVNYIALITHYTENDGLSVLYIKKILHLEPKTSVREILKKLNGDINNFIYYSNNGCFKICHSVVALKILESQYTIASTEFKDFLRTFVQDLSNCEGQKQTDRLNNLLMNLFIKRDIEGDISDNLVKKNFSPIILALKDPYLQETFFQFLSLELTNRAHFHQHYGRLIIYNNPDRISDAKEQFDQAIQLEPSNPLHYHARGQMYTKHAINLCRYKYKNSSVQELFNAVSQFVEAAIEDYEQSTKLIMDCTDSPVDLSYPYASIIQTVTYIVHQLYLKDNTKVEEKDFLDLNSEVSKWCRQMISKAKQYDMATENRFDSIRENLFYKDIRKYLIKYQYTTDDIARKLLKAPNNLELMKEYLYSIDTKKERWEDKSQDELGRIILYCSQILSNSKERNEGILWRWFNASLNYKNANIVDMIAFLGTSNGAKESLTVQFMLYVIKFGVYIKSYDERILAEILDHIRNCKRLNQNSNKSSTRYYYSGQEGVGFCYSQEKAKILDGTVTKWESPQNGLLSLNIQPKLAAFFVPSVIGMTEEGAVGSKIDFRLGVSFDGFRAWTTDV